MKESVMLNDLEFSKIRELIEVKRQKKRLAKNEILEACMEVTADAICFIAKGDSILDGKGSEKEGLKAIKALSNMRYALQKMKKQIFGLGLFILINELQTLDILMDELF